MTEQEKEKYLCQKGWQPVNRDQWMHKKYKFRLNTEAAFLLQQKEDKRST